ncbi:MAG: cation diffusion facilitator family transporter, partial [Christensenellaceae bacterium]
MNIIYKLFRQDPNSREGIITTTSGMGIAVNGLIAIVKVIVGLLASSIAIVSEGVNNATDALTSILTLVGTKLAKKHPDKKHPFGYGRIEYLTGLVIATLVLVTGVEMLISSVKLVFAPEVLSISYISII